MVKKSRVFIGLTEVAGFYRALKYGYEQLDVPCTFVNIKGHRFQYGGDDWKWITVFLRYSAQHPKNKLWRFVNKMGRVFLFVWALVTHDVFIFGFNSSFFKNYVDLPILKKFGKKIVYQFHGSDSRPPFMDGSVMSSRRHRSVQDCINLTARKKHLISVIDRYADLLIDTPPQGIFHQRPFVLWMHLGVAVLPPDNIDLTMILAEVETKKLNSDQPVCLLHCPSDPEGKGSACIRSIIQELQDKGLNLALVEIIGQPNAVVQKALQSCDIVIDQLYADYGMPGFATEAAWYGKPVIIAGYAAELWREILPEEAIPPTYYCHPDDLPNAIEKLATDSEYRLMLGLRARQFVENNWHPAQIAQRYLDLLKGSIPEGWDYDPQNTLYWQGCCFPEEQTRSLIREMMRVGGIEAFQLADHPGMQQLLSGLVEKMEAL